ncbi:hypothetical protein SAMN05443144_12656 [Fodinibius roseus]|uniref:Uncharacterized protein n=2 Tax=Fodinibius roseus TaxID=1194090 RepID=A0A1M5JD82_9BACT|nr:hypothetical protein SAMN05443144_12656 [Fodinibius roseus]
MPPQKWGHGQRWMLIIDALNALLSMVIVGGPDFCPGNFSTCLADRFCYGRCSHFVDLRRRAEQVRRI